MTLKQETHLPVVRRWCLSLAVLSAINLSRDDAEMKMAAYVPLLMREFPDAAFTADSLSHVARRAAKGFPTYGELCGWLGEWWADHRPLPVMIAAPEPVPLLTREPPTPEMVEHVRRVAAETIAALRARTPDVRLAPPTARQLTPAQLDALNPLPGGRKRAPPP
jgi:hypothetical protein